MISNSGLLYIEPSAKTSRKPLIDQLTRKMTAAFRKAKESKCSFGFHTCACGVRSTACDYELPNGEETNSLCIHYLAFHRDEVPREQLKKVEALSCGEAEPTAEELNDPNR